MKIFNSIGRKIKKFFVNTFVVEPKRLVTDMKFFAEVAALVMLAVLFRSVVYEPYLVPSSSMLPNLIEGDRILISKFRYGISRYSFPFSPKIFSGRILQFSEPTRGEILVFETDKIYVKRLIGLPGDTIQMIGGVLYINGHEVPKKADGHFLYEHNTRLPQYTETLPEGKTITTLDIFSDSEYDNTCIFKVPADHYFMMGDNRDNSNDSRNLSGIGFVHKDNILGRADYIYLSAPTLKMYDIPGMITGFRKERFFKKLH